ncbi:MAG: lasso peptide biosynthesis B2 protein [Candidatus Velthaea sp.]
MTQVSVVIPVYNGAETIGAMLAALCGQAGAPPDLEIIVVDNGSTDDTRAVVSRFANVQLLDEPVRGPAAARNRGLRAARGEIVVHLDADTLPTRRWLAPLVAPFADPAVVLAAGRTLCFAPRTAAERYIAAAGLYETDRAVSRPPFPFAPSLNMAVRRSAALAVGGWSQDLMTAEDVDFSQRILARFPGPIAYAADAVLFHRVRSTPAALAKLAFTYGEGIAHMYRRYPDKAAWDTAKSLNVAGKVAVRTIRPAVLAAGHRFGGVSAERLEFARYHALWTRNFFRGFAHAYYGRAAAHFAPKWSPAGFTARLLRVIRKPGDVVLALRIGWFVWRAPAQLRREHLERYLTRLRARRRPRAAHVAEARERIARIRDAWLGMPFFRNRDNCYIRALALYRFLDGNGRRVDIHFGIEPVARDARLRGHAWISVDGEVFEGPPDTAVGLLREIPLRAVDRAFAG